MKNGKVFCLSSNVVGKNKSVKEKGENKLFD